MNSKLKEKILEAVTSVLPITAIVLILSILTVPLTISTVMLFLTGALLLVVGMGFFSLGADMAMIPMGEGIGNQLTKINKAAVIAALAAAMGFIITIAEPDLEVLARQVSAVPDEVLIYTVAVGVGIFLAAALMRILFRISLRGMLLVSYGLLLIVSFFVPQNFLAIAFDSGGVTTGPITVPFILALGIGLSASRCDKSAREDSFGLVALCSIGPVLAVMLLGILYNPEGAGYEQVIVPQVETMQDAAGLFAAEFPDFGKEVLLALAPVCIFFLMFQTVFRKFTWKQLRKMGVGVIYTYIGLVLFLTGVNVGFIPVGNLLGADIAGSAHRWLLVPLGMIIGYFMVAAEPAVHVLNKQVEEITAGAVSAGAMKLSLSAGVAVSVGLSMIRVLTGISIYWFLIPGYGIAFLLSRFVPKMFTGIAFDSGGVASGPMTTTFLLPFAMGACERLGGNIMTDAFGIVAMVAMTPLIAIQVMGLVYNRKLKKSAGRIEQNDFPVIPELEEANL